MITVNEVMSTQVITLQATDSVSAASELMKNKEVRHIPIVDDNHFPVGIVTQRDILRAQDSDLTDNQQDNISTMIACGEIAGSQLQRMSNGSGSLGIDIPQFFPDHGGVRRTKRHLQPGIAAILGRDRTLVTVHPQGHLYMRQMFKTV